MIADKVLLVNKLGFMATTAWTALAADGAALP